MAGKKKVLKIAGIAIGILVVAIVAVTAYFYYDFKGGAKPAKPMTAEDSVAAKKNKDSMFVAAVVPDEYDNDSLEVVRMSTPVNTDIPYMEDINAGKNIKRVYTGRRLNIVITGVDGRLGTATKHADANHVLSILLDSGKIEITSIPRDTPADAGYEDPEHPQNKLTIVRARRGRDAYLKEVARIAHLDKIHYYVEVGFSQVMGILELLGFDDAGSTLQLLRSRKALGGNDFQRCYNQGQFIRQMLLRHFNKLSGLSGEVLLRGGLAIVESNIDLATAQKYIDLLKKHGFPSGPNAITVKVRPPYQIRYKKYDFTNDSVVYALKNKIESANRKSKSFEKAQMPDVKKVLDHAVNKAIRDSSRSPVYVISGLKNYFDQRAWFQVKNKMDRSMIRDQIAILLIDAYNKKGDHEKAEEIRRIIEDEKKLFNSKVF